MDKSELNLSIEIPSHVPLELVRNLTIGRGLTTTRLPHAVVDDIHRDFPPVFYAPNLMNGGGWVFRRTEDQITVIHNPEHFSSKQIQPYAEMVGASWSMIPVEQDPPEHGFYRRLLMPFFVPKTADNMDANINDYARAQVLNFRDKGHCEFMSEFAFPFPSMIFLEMMGMPIARLDEFIELYDTITRDGDMDRVLDGVKSVIAYFEKEIEARRDVPPGDDLMSFALTAEIDGRKLSHDELVALFFNLGLAGLDTVSAHMGHIFRHLAENPDQQEDLRQNPDKIDSAITELMRAYGAVTITRTCVKDTEVAGIQIKEGDKVCYSTALAARDPEIYDEPEKIIFDRESKSYSFGTGIHVCIGMHIARRELRAAIRALLELLPPFRIPPGTVIESDLGTVMMPLTLPLEWGIQDRGV